ncbi:hypothetical protein PISMIDRAFT_589055 [Pisolithus microcarpus 441]|uniref:Uncharacterized protein n=1 Tax=Pisolithus microcarpus 441 TaxID=765257 RepID=A0A0C9YUD8_9AGAM|nr:hypothetical protein PISMIDRAFT_589055 [Pisolithus microcarpus 441]
MVEWRVRGKRWGGGYDKGMAARVANREETKACHLNTHTRPCAVFFATSASDQETRHLPSESSFFSLPIPFAGDVAKPAYHPSSSLIQRSQQWCPPSRQRRSLQACSTPVAEEKHYTLDDPPAPLGGLCFTMAARYYVSHITYHSLLCTSMRAVPQTRLPSTIVCMNIPCGKHLDFFM